jgi:hypothetical protein
MVDAVQQLMNGKLEVAVVILEYTNKASYISIQEMISIPVVITLLLPQMINEVTNKILHQGLV